ncbi:Type IV secretion system protein virB5 [Paraburkholderia nemoris]|uniref:P-type DNA transfer protein VirB5 n=1 Tax=Paraburkholderia nemoris TaxID=2793076 RepID=UPI00190C6E17|nr:MULTISPECIES: P-type DNA transfer protein VirB5 [Paraburkholderia]MBK3786058.1 P-type DNA transfer protein VirB5 [Paraburkholderia aspalathi]CAE6846959.1 Type IV secretion system protein virB5 [Paraburkholderia nemoris]
MKQQTTARIGPARALCVALAIAASCVCAPARAQGIPVIDVSTLAQAVLTVQNMVQAVTTLQQQYQTMSAQYTALTGNRGLGQILNNPSLTSYLPSSWQSIYQQVKNGQLSGISGAAQQIESDEGMTANTPGQQRYNDTVSANKAMTMQAYSGMLSRLQNIQNLMQQSDLTQDPASKADLQNRLQSENAMIQNEQTRLALMGRLQDIEEKLAQRQAEQDVHNQMAQ